MLSISCGGQHGWGAYVPDLRTDPLRMAELYAHLKEMESTVPYFYCDDHHLVTIAIGYLVDQSGAADEVGAGLARALARRGDVAFTRNGVGVDADDVVADWRRVKTHGSTHPADGAPRYAAVAQLRVSDQTMRNLTNTKVAAFADQLYANRPFVVEYDARVAMAFIDARYNPARVQLYTADNPDVPKMWNALDPRHREFNPTTGIALFESIWAYKQSVPERYIRRHFRRVQWMRLGLSEMGYLQN
jgi:hypothetical protein